MAQDAQLISQAGQVESLASDGLVSVSTGAGQPQKNMELAKFADSLGSSVPLQQNAEQVSITGLYARTSDGKMVELTKESVASVMAGLMGNPLRREYVVTADNADNALKPGFYTMVFEPISIGGGTSNFYGVMNVYESDTYIVQVGYATSGVILRNYRKSSKVWSAWQRIDNFGFNSLAELSSGVAEQIGYIGKKSYTIESGQEVSTGFTGAGAYVIFNASAGRSALVVAGAIALDAAAILYNDADISHSLSASGKVCFNRKAVNGEFFLKNNHTTSLNITIVPL